VLRRSEQTRFSSASDDEVGGLWSAIHSERSEQSNTVPKEGLEPSHPKAQEPKSCVSTSSTTPAVFDCLTRCARSARIAPLERAYFIVARGREACPLPPLQHGAWRDPCWIASLAALARRGSRLWSAPTSSSLGDEKACPLALYILLAPLAEAGACEPLPSSLARRRKTCLLARSSRTAARQPISARRGRDPGFACFACLVAAIESTDGGRV
jgi:hypothetical protein